MIAMSLCLLCCVAGAGEAVYEAELIFPPDPKHNHGSSIVETAQGDLIAAWFHGSGERTSDDVLIQGARKRAGAAEWSAPFVMADTPDLPDCNPVLFIDPRGVLWLLWIAVQDNQWGGSLLKYRTAKDYAGDGPPKWDWQDVIHARPVGLEERFLAIVTYAETNLGTVLDMMGYREEIAGLRAVASNKLSRRLGWMTRLHPIMTSDTRMMLGLYSDVFNCSLAAFTEDWGRTWSFSQPILDDNPMLLGNIQPSFVRKANGDIMAFMRDNGIPKCVRTAVSTDNGITWSPLGKLAIRNPGSSIECIALKSGAWVLVCNDTLEGRHLLTAYLSEDEGATWPHSKRLEECERDQGSYSYPSVIQGADGVLHCTYSWREKDSDGSSIKHALFNEAWLRE